MPSRGDPLIYRRRVTPPDPPGISFLDDEQDDDHASDELGGGSGRRAPQRRVAVEQWLPRGGGAAIASVVFVLVAWLGAQPLVYAVATLAPQGQHRIGHLTEQSIDFGNTEYFGVTPGLIPVITYGTRVVVALLALVLALRARAVERSALATAAWSTSALSGVLFAAGGVVMAIGLAHGHPVGAYGSTF